MSEYYSYNDQRLLQLMKEDDEVAFKTIFERYRERIFAYLLKHTKSTVIAEEIVSDVFMKLWEGRLLVGEIRELPAFLHKVSYYKAIDFFRTTSRQQRLQQVYVDNAGINEQKIAEDNLIDEEVTKIIIAAVNQLPPKRKLIYQLSREEGLTHEQIARALNLSPSTVNNALGAATKSILKYIQPRLVDKQFVSVFFLL